MLIFSVTRVVFVPFGDVAAFAALSLAALETGRMPPTIGLVLDAGALALRVEIVEASSSAARRGADPARHPAWGLLPALPCLRRVGRRRAAWVGVAAADRRRRSWWCRSRRCCARLTLQPIADASVLVLLIVSLALHFLLSGLGLLFFGPEGSRTAPLADATWTIADGFNVSGQTLLMVGLGAGAERPLLSSSSSAR